MQNTDLRILGFHKDYKMSIKRLKKGLYNLKFHLLDGIHSPYESSCNKILEFINKYNIKTFDDFIREITLSMKDLNKYVKINSLNGNDKREVYTKKDHLLKILLEENYINRITKQKINGVNFPLFWTNIKNKKSFNGYVSFHIPPNRNKKFNIVLDKLDKENEYNKDNNHNFIENENRMKEGSNIIESLKNDKIMSFVKELFNQK